jgi:hypothetical protein
MKQLLLFIYVLTNTSLFAQITISSSNIVSVNDLVKQAEDTATGNLSVGSAGASQIWNYASLQNHKTDTFEFISSSGLPGSSTFPTANMAIKESDSAWIYVSKTSSAFDIVGFAQLESDGSTSTFSLTQRIITFPSTYNTSFSSSSWFIPFSGAAGFDPDGGGPHPYVDSIRYSITQNLSSMMDAWGNMTTPLGTFPVLRQKINDTEIDSIQMYANNTWQPASPEVVAAMGENSNVIIITSYTMRWWSNDSKTKFPLVETEYDPNTLKSNGYTSWLKEFPTVSINELSSENEYRVFPNPAQEYITFLLSNQHSGKVEIYNMSGQWVNEYAFSNNIISIPVYELHAGIYQHKIYNAEGVLSGTGKFNVVK